VRTIRIVLALSSLFAGVSAAAATPDSISTARLAQQLRETHYARIGAEAKTVVVVKPRVASEGLAYESARTAAIWSPMQDRFVSDTLPPPPNPVPWERIDQIEAGTNSRRRGTVIGGSLGLLTGIAVGGAALAKGNAPWGYAALFGAAGAGVGAMFSTTQWKHVYPEPVAAGFDSVPPDRVERQLRYAHYTRIDSEGHTYELINPRVLTEGIEYERIPGYPKTRPAVVAAADWDSLPMPPNPIPWSRIDRIEKGFPTGTHGARNGALIGLAATAVFGGILVANDSYYAIGLPAAFILNPLLGAVVGSAFHSTRWEQVYPGSNPEKR